MQDAQDFNPFPFDTVDGNERRAADDQLAGSLHASFTPHQGTLGEQVDLAVDPLIELDCSLNIVCGNVIQLNCASERPAAGCFREVAKLRRRSRGRNFSGQR